MRPIELEIVVPAPPREAFPWVVEPGLLREWLPQLEELRPQGFLHHRPVVRHGALRLALEARVVRVVVPELFELDVAWRAVTGRSTLAVDDHDDGSLVTWSVALELPPAFWIARAGVARELRRTMGRGLERLAERLGEPGEGSGDEDDVPPPGPTEPLDTAHEVPGTRAAVDPRTADVRPGLPVDAAGEADGRGSGGVPTAPDASRTGPTVRD